MKTIDSESLDILRRLRDDYEHYSSRCLKIRTKSGKIHAFEMNRAQKYVHAKVEEQRKRTGMVRAIVLKGRQQGMSTYIEGRFYWRVTFSPGMRAFILTHEEEATKNLFEMAKRYHENCDPAVKHSTKASNSTELVFDAIDSGYKLGTAGNKSVGRSSTIQFLHASEAAFYKHADEHAKGILQTVPLAPNTEVFLESTANGVGNWFHQQWQAAESGESDYIAIFVPWFWQEEYRRDVPQGFSLTDEEIELQDVYRLTPDQIAWRRVKIAELSVNGTDGAKAFKQEYPCNAAEAFQMSGEDSFISPETVVRTRKGEAEPYGPLVIGVDPARFGDDRSAIIKRRGRVAFDLQTYVKKDTMEIAGIVYGIIQRDKPVKVFVDVVGLGAGVVDRLRELTGYSDVIVAVNSAERAINDNLYANKRAEIWALGKEWLQDLPAKIPDSDEMHSDLCGVKYKTDSKGRLLIESKADMKRRGVRSSDTADALLMTFALPVSAYQTEQRKADEQERAKRLMGGFQKAVAARRKR
jgi:hypothetical protein